MTRTVRLAAVSVAASAALLLGAAAPAVAQTAPSAGVQPGSGPMVVERVRNGFTAAPVVRFGQVDDETRVLAGGEAGWVIDQRLMIGGAGYGLVNGIRDEVIAYGGLVVAWQFLPPGSPIRFGVKTLIGAGTATLPADIEALPAGALPRRGAVRTGIFPGPRIFVRDDYAVFEPEVTLMIRLCSLIHVSAGAAWRHTANAGLLENRLNGPTAGLTVHFAGW
ncbi:MAG: hypothetical protein AB7P67_11800 [Vicinamibacterales bacterium]